MLFLPRLLRRLAPVLLALPVLLLSGRTQVAMAGSEAQWESVSLDGGAVVDLAATAGKPATVWAVTPVSGVFRSLDGARTWSRIRKAPSPRSWSVSVDPLDGDRAFVMFLHPQHNDYTHLGLFFTTDGGATWSPSREGLENGFVYQVAFDPRDTDVLYAAASTGLHRSVDGGRTWTRLWLEQSVFAVAVAPDDPRLLLISILDRVYRSTDGGATFNEVLRSGMYSDIVFDPRDPSRVYGTSGPLFRSTDRGLTWEWIGRKLRLSFEAVAVGRDGTLYAGSLYGVFRSSNGGTTFIPRSTPDVEERYPEDGIAALAPLANGDVLAAGARGVWRRSGEGGWKAASRGIRGLDIASLAVTAGGRLLVSVPQNAVFRSDDGGEGFRAGSQGLLGIYGGPVLRLVPAPSDPRVVYAGGGEGTAFRSDDGGVSWRPLPLPNAGRLVTVLAVHPTDPDTVYAGGEEYHPRDDYGKCHALRSRDGGATWDCLEGDDLYTMTSLVIDPSQPRRLFAVNSSELLISENEGATWREAGRGLPSTNDLWVQALDTHGRLLIGTGDGRLFRSLDHGASFSLLSRGLPGGIRGLLVDPLRDGTLYALVYQRGVFRSRDEGLHWERLDAGLPVERFTGAAALDAERGLLFAGTNGRGLFRLDVR